MLGVGGFGTVVAAFDPALDAQVALKILNAQYSSDLRIRDRFVQEARLLRRVRSPYVVNIHDIGETDDHLPYFVMELADGGVLADRMPVGEVDAEGLRDTITALAAGLSALHAAGIVHRDIKPANLLITGGTQSPSRSPSATLVRLGLLGSDERIVIGDLGLAKDADRTSVDPTIIGGTPQFRAPEQVRRGATIGPATDIYAATAVLWNLLTGSPPPDAAELRGQLPQ
ncbi:MAG: eukaryotic-like serine/threonine-protein kinase, partial [Actinomycetota bacterium]|nr:eukaryotic-like serine/threonine-protein kinase [Actinomycetota bacterium]